MGAVLSALLAGFATLFRSHLALQLEILALRHQLAIYQRTVKRPRIRPRRPRVLVLAIPSLGRMAGGSGLRSARDCNRLAAQTVSRSLGAHEPSWKARPTSDQQGDPRAHSEDLWRESAVGHSAHHWRAGEARHRRGEVNGGQVPCPTPQAVLADVEGVSEESRYGSGVDRLLHRTDDPVQATLRPGRARARSPHGDSFQRHRESDRSVDGPADRRSLPMGQRAEISASRSRRDLRQRVSTAGPEHGDRAGPQRTAKSVAEPVRGAAHRHAYDATASIT